MPIRKHHLDSHKSKSKKKKKKKKHIKDMDEEHSKNKSRNPKVRVNYKHIIWNVNSAPSAKIKKEWSCGSACHTCLHGVDRENLACSFTFWNMMLIKGSKLVFHTDITGRI